MNRPLKLTTAAVGLALALGAVAPAQAADTEIRESNFVSGLSDTRATGHFDFLQEGLRVYTEGNTSTDKVAEYFDASGSLPSAVSLEWFGTTPQPGSQVVFDVDSDRTNDNTYNILVGEPIYGDDFWYTGGQTRAAARGFTCPSTSGGSGSDCHGTLEQWRTALPAAEVYALGFSLGSGVKGDGVIRSLTVDDTSYVFTDREVVEPPAPAPVVDVRGTVTTAPSKARTITVVFTTREQPADTTQGAKLSWRVKVDGKNVAGLQQGSGEQDVISQSFPRNSGVHQVQVFKDGDLVRTFQVRTNR